jgi:hypothetical protein
MDFPLVEKLGKWLAKQENAIFYTFVNAGLR